MKAVLFDVDGTLVKAGGAGRRALNRAVAQLYGVRRICSKFSLAGRMDRENFRLAYLHATRCRLRPREAKRIEGVYLRHLPREVLKAVRTERYENVRGIHRLLRHLSRRRDVLIGLGTGNLQEGAWIKLEPSGLAPYFSFGGFGTDGRSRAQMLRKAVRRAQKLAGTPLRARDVYVIGDTEKDVLAARRLGYRAGAVTNGFGDIESLRRCRPEILEPDFRDPRPWMRWIDGPLTPRRRNRRAVKR